MPVVFCLLLQIHSLHFFTLLSAPGSWPAWLTWEPFPSGLASGKPQQSGRKVRLGYWLCLQGITLGWLYVLNTGFKFWTRNSWQPFLCDSLQPDTGNYLLSALVHPGYCSVSSHSSTPMQINLVWLHWFEYAICFLLGLKCCVFILEIKTVKMNHTNRMHTDAATWNTIFSDWQKNRGLVVVPSESELKIKPGWEKLRGGLPWFYSSKSSHRTTPGVPFTGCFRLTLGAFVNQNYFCLVRRAWEQIEQFYLGEIRLKSVPTKATKNKRNSQTT